LSRPPSHSFDKRCDWCCRELRQMLSERMSCMISGQSEDQFIDVAFWFDRRDFELSTEVGSGCVHQYRW
jgi:hypothetical protein